MKVAVVTPVYPPYTGGIGAVAEAQVQDLRKLGVEVQVFTPNYPDRQKPTDAVALKPLFSLGNAAVLPSLLTTLKSFDLVHLHYPFYGSDVFVWLGSIIFRRPYVLTYHMHAQADDYREYIFKLHRRLLEPLIFRRARKVMVSSLDYAQSVGLKHRRLVELPFGVDEQRFSPGTDIEFRREHGLDTEALTFIFVGGLDKAHYFKGLEILLKAAALLPTQTRWQVLIVGDGDLRVSYEEQAKGLGIKDRCFFVGRISEIDLPRAYRASNVHILPSINQGEAYGLVTLEAAASGLPSLVSNLAGVRTLVEPGQTGRVVTAGDVDDLATEMRKFLAQPELAKVMGAAARDRVLKSYTRAGLAERLQTIYQS